VKLSIIVVCYDMAREIPRTIQSLSRSYQRECSELDYEVLIIDNGSSEPMAQVWVDSLGSEFQYFYLEEPPPSPAYALNFGAAKASGDILGLVVDGAHLLTPGVLAKAAAATRAMSDSVVITRYFYLGPGPQNETILQGYNKEREDQLLRNINWPNAGYRLFEIGTPLVYKDFPNYTWFYKPLESNCLFLRKANYLAIGGADERFDKPGGGFMNIDLFKRACDFQTSQPVMLIGEGSFHQLHGGTTTNIHPKAQDQLVASYLQQYRDIRGTDFQVTKKNLYFYGNMPTRASEIHRLN